MTQTEKALPPSATFDEMGRIVGLNGGLMTDYFALDELEWKILKGGGDKNWCVTVWYVKAHRVMSRLDDVLGAVNWRTETEIIDGYQDFERQRGPSKLEVRKVRMTLRIRVGEHWHQVEGVGIGKDVKAAESDALKRAAVKLGVGRYLAELGTHWSEYNPNEWGEKAVKRHPVIPSQYLPGGSASKPKGKTKRNNKNTRYLDGIRRGKPETDTEGRIPLRNFANALEAEGLLDPSSAGLTGVETLAIHAAGVLNQPYDKILEKGSLSPVAGRDVLTHIEAIEKGES